MVVPQLGRKLRLLISHGPYPDMGALARALGRSPETLRWWQSGDAAREANTVPAAILPVLIDLYRDALPNLTADQVKRLVLGPADDLERLLAPNSAASFRALIEREADRSSGSLFSDDGLSLVSVNRALGPAPHARVRLGQPFRIEFRSALRGGFAVAFQAAPGGWGFVPCGLSPSRRTIFLPDCDADGTPGMMCEETERGRHLFIAAQATRPFPADLGAAAMDGAVLDRALLAQFVLDYEARPAATRRLFVMDVEMLARAEMEGAQP